MSKEQIVKDRFLTAREVVEVFFEDKLKYSRVLKMTREGYLPAVKMGKSYVYSLKELEKWAEKNFSTPSWVKVTMN